MLTLYDSFDVPGVPNLKVFRDDEVPHRFYMVSERATVARDDEGQAIFNFILYARDVDRLPPEELEVERGYLAITTQAAVSKEVEDKVRAFLKQKLEQERNRFFLFNLVSQSEPELGYPPLWLEGTTEFRAVPEDMVIFSAGSSVPSLMGSNVASFATQLNQDGAELFRQSLEKGLITAGVWYKLAFAARIPAITIRIHGDRGAFYNEVKNYVRKHWTWIEEHDFLGWTWSREEYHVSWDELSSISKFRNEFHALTIEIDDTSLPGEARSEMTKKLEDMAMEIVQTNILPSFFEPALKDVAQEIKDPHAMIPVNESLTGHVDVTLTRSELVKKTVNPNAFLSQALTPDEIKAATAYIDLSDTFFKELDVTVNANVNFAADPVFALKVGLEYDQQDEVRNTRVKKAKTFLFKEASQVFRFRQIMAKASDGSAKDSYRYWSEISYKDTGQTIRVPASGTLESRERQLVISYQRLGFIKVNLLLASMPDNIKSVQVTMTYPGSSLASAKQSFELTPEKPTASFFTYTGKTGDPGPYRYQVSYVLSDGQRMDLPEQNGQGETLTLQDPFEERATARFLAQADFSVVEKLLVDARYRDQDNDYSADFHAEFSANGETQPWSIGLRDPNKRSYDYDLTILYKNGSREEKKGQKAEFGSTVPLGGGGVDALEVTVIPSLIDWVKYKLVIASLVYDDTQNNVHEEKNLTFRPDNSTDDQVWRVLLRDKTKKSFSYRLRFIAADSTNNRELGPTSTQDPVLVIQ
jgi:hypothetical protein